MNRIPAVALLAFAVLTAIAAAVVSSSAPGTGLIIGIGAMWLATAAAIAWQPLGGTTLAGLFGTGISAYLVMQHDAALSGGSGSVCNIDETFNCDLVNTSSFAEFGGIPIAIFGAAFYAAAALISLLSWQKVQGFAKAPKILAVASGVAVLGALYLAWASSTLGAWCLFCIGTYGLSALLLGGALFAARHAEPSPAAEDGDKSLMVALVAGLVVLGIGIMGSAGEQAVPGSEGSEEGDIAQLFTKVDGVVEMSGQEPCWGNPDAKYTLLEFADFECPHCGVSFPELKPLVARHPDLRVCFKNYPLANECNSSVGGSMHPNACMAAAASLCAQDQGRFWELSGEMFANQQTLFPGDILFMGEKLGLDKASLKECMLSPETLVRVETDAAAGNKAGLWATPTLFLKGAHPTEQWIQLEYGTEGADVLLQALDGGEVLPAARPPEPRP